jgi:citrate synthase
MLAEGLPADKQDADLDAAAAAIFDDYTKRKQRMPGIGQRTYAEGDPHAATLFNIAKDTGAYGK